jgi:phospholipid/cholesterol/gamma-HCH transport system substrate-binding protein
LAFPRDELKAAAIIAGSLITLSILVVLIGGTRLFKNYDTYYTKISNAAGLEVGAQVRLGGVRAGRVLDIVAPQKPGDLVTIVIGVNKGTPLYNGTTARISQVGFVGDIYLLLSVKSTGAGRLDPGSTLPSDEPVEFSELMEGLDRISVRLDVLLRDMDRLFNEKNIAGIERLVENTNSAIVNASSNLDEVTRGLYETTDKMREVLDEVKLLVREGRGDFNEVMEKATKDLERAEATLEAVEETARKVGDASDAVGGAVGRQDQNIDELLSNLNRTLRDLQDLLQELRLKPWSVIYQEEGQKKEGR